MRRDRTFPFLDGGVRLESARWGRVRPEAALSRESALARTPAEGTFRIFTWEPASAAVVLGRGLDPGREVFLGTVSGDCVPVLVRPSGGGAVFLPENGRSGTVLCVGMVFPVRGFDFRALSLGKTYEAGVEVLRRAVFELGVRAGPAGTSDLAVGGRKLAGSAQSRKRSAVLFHASILLDAPVEGMERYLRLPSSMPEYRAGRRHGDFVTDLRRLTGIGPGELLRRLPGLLEASARRLLRGA